MRKNSPSLASGVWPAVNLRPNNQFSRFGSGLLFLMKRHLVLLLGIALPGSMLLAADPTNPILFVTQVPMPEEVNTRTITSSYMSCVSPFGSHLGGTAFAGRGGSLWVRFPANQNPGSGSSSA